MGELIGAILVVLFIFGTGLIIDLVEYIIKGDEYDEEHVIFTRKDKHKHRRTKTYIKD